MPTTSHACSKASIWSKSLVHLSVSLFHRRDAHSFVGMRVHFTHVSTFRLKRQPCFPLDHHLHSLSQYDTAH